MPKQCYTEAIDTMLPYNDNFFLKTSVSKQQTFISKNDKNPQLERILKMDVLLYKKEHLNVFIQYLIICRMFNFEIKFIVCVLKRMVTEAKLRNHNVCRMFF